MALQTELMSATGLRPWAEGIATAVLATILGFFLSIAAMLFVPYYSTPVHELIVALLPWPPVRNAANVVLLLMVPNLAASFCWAYVALRLASLIVRPGTCGSPPCWRRACRWSGPSSRLSRRPTPAICCSRSGCAARSWAT